MHNPALLLVPMAFAPLSLVCLGWPVLEPAKNLFEKVPPSQAVEDQARKVNNQTFATSGCTGRDKDAAAVPASQHLY